MSPKLFSHWDAAFSASHFTAFSPYLLVLVTFLSSSLCLFIFEFSIYQACCLFMISCLFWTTLLSNKIIICFSFFSECWMCMIYLECFICNNCSFSVGPGGERALWWRIPVHRESSRPPPSSGEDRGHRRLTATLLSVSRLFAARNIRSCTQACWQMCIQPALYSALCHMS